MKCKNNIKCGCKLCKSQFRLHYKQKMLAISLTEKEVVEKCKMYKGYKYPKGNEQMKESGLKSFWSGVYCYKFINKEELRNDKLNKLGI